MNVTRGPVRAARAFRLRALKGVEPSPRAAAMRGNEYRAGERSRMLEELPILSTPRSSAPKAGARTHPRVQPGPALVAADLGFTAFAERNRPRYTRYAEARLSAGVVTVVRATLAYAHRHWDWLLNQPCLAADVWEELRHHIRCEADDSPPQDAGVAALYHGLPETSADSVVLCHGLGLSVDEAAELMGLEPPAVEAGLGVARRALPHLAGGKLP